MSEPTPEQEAALQALADGAKAYQEFLDCLKQEEEEYWASLSTDQQLMAFCAVVRRLTQGELVEQRSYRGILYDVFGFGLEAYSRSQNAGFIELHNAIETDDGK